MSHINKHFLFSSLLFWKLFSFIYTYYIFSSFSKLHVGVLLISIGMHGCSICVHPLGHISGWAGSKSEHSAQISGMANNPSQTIPLEDNQEYKFQINCEALEEEVLPSVYF